MGKSKRKSVSDFSATATKVLKKIEKNWERIINGIDRIVEVIEQSKVYFSEMRHQYVIPIQDRGIDIQFRPEEFGEMRNYVVEMCDFGIRLFEELLGYYDELYGRYEKVPDMASSFRFGASNVISILSRLKGTILSLKYDKNGLPATPHEIDRVYSCYNFDIYQILRFKNIDFYLDVFNPKQYMEITENEVG